MAVQNIPIKDLDVELQGNMEFFVDRLEKKCSSPDGFSDLITPPPPATNGTTSAASSSSSSNTPQSVPSSARKIDPSFSLASFPLLSILMCVYCM